MYQQLAALLVLEDAVQVPIIVILEVFHERVQIEDVFVDRLKCSIETDQDLQMRLPEIIVQD